MEKNVDLKFNISVTAQQYTGTNVRFSTQDEGSAKLTFFLFKDGVELPLNAATGKMVMKMADGSKFVVTVTIVDKVKGIAEYKLTTEQLKYYGVVVSELYLNYENGQSISVHRFSFTIEQALIDQDIPVLTEYYVNDFEELKASIIDMAEETYEVIRTVEGNLEEAKDLAEETISLITDNQAVKKVDYNVDKDYTNAELATKAEQAFVETMLANVVSGAPKGVYTTLTALRNAFPTGTQGVFLVLADGHIYYWNDTAWSDAGIYQGVKLGNGTLGLDAFSSQGKLLRNYPLAGNANSLRISDGGGKMYAGANIHQLFFIGKYDRYYIRSFFSKHSSDSSREISIRDKDGNEEFKFHADPMLDTDGNFVYPDKEFCQLTLNGEVRGFAVISWTGVDNVADYTFADTELHASCFVNINKIASFLPDGFVKSTSKLADKIVTIDKMANNSVAADQVVNDSMTTRKFALQTMARNYPLAGNANAFRASTGGQNIYAGDCIHQLFFVGKYDRYYINAIFGKHSSDSHRQITIRDKDSKERLQFSAAATYDSSGNFIYPEKEVCQLTDQDGVVRGYAIISWAKAPSIADYAFADTEIHASCFVNSTFLQTFLPIQTAPAYDKVNQRLVSPKRMYVIKGEKLPIYKNSIVFDSTKNGGYDLTLITYDAGGLKTPLYSYVGIPIYQSFSGQATLEGLSNLDSKLSLAVRPAGNTSKIYRSDIGLTVVDPATKSGKTVNVICMGDSITEGGVPRYLKRRLVRYNVTANLLGTNPDQFGAGYHEGYSGRALKQFIGARTDWASPFMKLATEADKTKYPNWCFRRTSTAGTEKSYTTDTDKTGDFYIFDFVDYLSKNTLTTPDIVSIALGTNDLALDKTWTYANFSNAIEFVISQIKLANTNIKIGVIPPPTFANNEYGNARNLENMVLVEDLINKVETIRTTVSNVELVPVYAHFNRDYSYNTTQVGQIEKSNFYEYDISDPVHPFAQSREEYLNAMIAYG